MTCTVLFQTVKVTGAEFKLPVKMHPTIKNLHANDLALKAERTKVWTIIVNALINAWNHICLFFA